MSYALIKAGVETQLAAVSGFSTANIGYEDWQPVQAGVAKAVVLSYGGFTRERNTFGDLGWCDWTFILKLYNAFTDDVPTTRAAQDVDRQALLDRFRSYPQLGGVSDVFDSWMASGAPSPLTHQLGGIDFMMETYTLVVREDVSGGEQE